ncbi:MAG TPA: DNA-formamidopyrimidine glycosylase [Chloroflexota bacterium]|nr:DNA-formamidopyrimidine glycosylase [Chloroflexota bacterium]HUM68323.1 DNA-formamidopyrimidine glycosylase [Chloroflexota bacterium]
MPELPEVETTVRALRPYLVNRTITYVQNNWPKHVTTPTLPEMQWRLHGRTIIAINRRAKYLVFSLSDGETLIIHLKMSGRLLVVGRDEPADKHVHTVFGLDNGQELRFWDQRKFGRVYLVQEPQQVLAGLGPEPLAADFTVERLAERLHGRSRILKPLLLDQTFVAGIGNIYADESLFYARLHPQRTADSLTPEDVAALYAAMQKSLQLGIEREGASIDLYVKPDGSKGDMQNAVAVFRRTGLPCVQCGTPIRRIVLGGRSTHFCPRCQV